MAFVSAALLLLLVGLQLTTGVTQQWFESVHPIDDYGARLIAQAAWLRAIIAVDDVFVAAYTAAAILAALALRDRPVVWAIAAILGAVTGVLDLEENHQMLAFLVQAQRGVALTAASLEHRMVFSSLKWLLGPIGYCFLALSFTARSTREKALGFVVWGGLLPLTAAGMAVDDPAWVRVLAFSRLFSALAGFLLLGFALRGRANEGGSSALASLPGTRPAAAA
jgi:hypothetical protein